MTLRGVRREHANLRRSITKLCVLAALTDEPSHAYALSRRLVSWHELCGAEGDLYRCLRTLEAHGYLKHSWRSSDTGPPRKVYSVTTSGSSFLVELSQTWEALIPLLSHVCSRHRSI